MWKLYTSGAEGVAIQSTVGRLMDALKVTPRPFRVGPVDYIDHEADGETPVEGAQQTTNPMLSVLSKRKVFSHEREVRVTIAYLDDIASRTLASLNGVAPEIPSEFTGEEKGENVPIGLELLVERIVVSPCYPSWAMPVLQDAVDSAGLRITVEESAVHRKPPTAPK